MQRVTVVVPVYNVEKYLARCLDSLLMQTYDNYEVICVNDCSPDHSREILEKYGSKYPDVFHILDNEENIGQGRSRMRAVALASGDYIMFVDSDDYVADDYIERFMLEMQEDSYDLVVAGYTRDTDGNYQKFDVADSPWTLVCYPLACAKIFRKEFILQNGIDFTDARAGEDIYFNLAVFYQNLKYKIISYHGYYYYRNRSSTTGSLTYDRQLEVTVSRMFDIFLSRFPLESLSEQKKRMIEYTYITNMVNALITYGHGCRPHIMRGKYRFFMADLQRKFPDYKRNPCFGIWKPKGVSTKIRIGVGVTMLLHKIRLDPLLFWIISWVP